MGLDEATSALDATSRVVVFEAIKKWRKNRTTIVITHDLSQIVSHDFVYVMKDGVVAEQGFRSDLMNKGPIYGVFAALAAEQAVQPVPAKHEEYIAYEGSFMEILDGDDDYEPLYDRGVECRTIPDRATRVPHPSRFGGLRSSLVDLILSHTKCRRKRIRGIYPLFHIGPMRVPHPLRILWTT
jgi:hypothetical protein